METKTRLQRFQMIMSVYAKLTLAMLISSLITLIIGFGFVDSATAAPGLLIAIVEFIFLYHIPHFIASFILVGYYLFSIKKEFGQTKITAAIVSIFLTPISFLVAYLGLFMLAISSCSVA